MKKLQGRYIRIFVLSGISLVAAVIMLTFIGEPLQKAEIKLYQNITGKKPQHFTFDPQGIPMVAYEGKIGVKYNPVAVAEYAIKISDEPDSADLRIFMNCIGWLATNQVKLNDSSQVYYCNFDWPHYGMKKPWRSAMSQGRAAQAYIRAFEKSGDSVYLGFAHKAINTLFTPVKEGGVSYIEPGGYWFEEYADDSAGESRVLNGMCVVLQSLDDYSKITADTAARFLFVKGTELLKQSLRNYDNGRNTFYDIRKSPASAWYHEFHVGLMDDMYIRTKDPVFKEYHDRWAGFRSASFIEKLIVKPTRIGLFTVALVLAAVFTFIFCIARISSKKQ